MCKFTPLLLRYLDMEVSRVEQRIIEEHLSTCDECVAEHRKRLALSALLSSVNDIKAPAELADLVMTRLEQEHRMLGSVDLWLEKRSRTETASLAAVLAAIFAFAAPPLLAFTNNPGLARFIFALQSHATHLCRIINAPVSAVIGS